MYIVSLCPYSPIQHWPQALAEALDLGVLGCRCSVSVSPCLYKMLYALLPKHLWFDQQWKSYLYKECVQTSKRPREEKPVSLQDKKIRRYQEKTRHLILLGCANYISKEMVFSNLTCSRVQTCQGMLTYWTIDSYSIVYDWTLLLCNCITILSYLSYKKLWMTIHWCVSVNF